MTVHRRIAVPHGPMARAGHGSELREIALRRRRSDAVPAPGERVAVLTLPDALFADAASEMLAPRGR